MGARKKISADKRKEALKTMYFAKLQNVPTSPRKMRLVADIMGARKKISAEKRKEALKTMYFAKLQNVPTSPRKMRLVADMIRGMEVNRALGVLKFSSKEASARVEKLLRSAIANWEQKNERKAEDGELFVTKIYVDGGATLKRMRPAPQGRGYRIRKRSNHVTLFVDSKNTNDKN